MPGDKVGEAGIGIEEYLPRKPESNIVFIGSLYVNKGGRQAAVIKALDTISELVSDAERVKVSLNGRRWYAWKGYNGFTIANMKRNRGSYCGMLAEDALRRKSDITEVL